MKTLAVDIETYSPLDIAKVGMYKYAEHCEILLLAYAYDDEPVRLVDLASGEKIPHHLFEALYNPRILKTAYNAAFEITVLSKYFGKSMDSLQWQCTMVQGLTLGLPAGLEKIGKALDIESDKRKLTTGKKLIQFFSKPRKAKKKSELILFENDLQYNRNLPVNNAEKWALFKEYCKQDVEAERAIRKRLEHLNGSFTLGMERYLWKLDQTINSLGVWVDEDLVKGALAVYDAIKAEALEQGERLTGGLNLNSNQQMFDWFEKQEGYAIESLNKASRELLKESELTPQVREFLRLKDILSKTSVKKYEAMEATVGSDHRARGMFQFYGANRTGRWSGRHIQLQNLPQNHMEDLDIARQFVRKRNHVALEIFFENPAEVLSQVIRTAFVAAEGSRFIVADFSAIEARVLSWLANEQWRNDVFAEGGDIYSASASTMFKVPVEKHGVNKDLRVKGKIAELSCGYGGGVDALKAFGADKMGLSESEMSDIIKTWRATNPNICRFWRIMECCAKIAVRDKTTKLCQKGISFEYKDDFLFVKLPSGRRLAYPHPKIVVDGRTNREYLTYDGTVQPGNGWGRVSTWGGKLVENIVQAIARDCLAVSMLQLNNKGYNIVMHVHDEIVLEMPKGVGTLDEVLAVMREPLYWAKGLVLDAEGYETEYYHKE